MEYCGRAIKGKVMHAHYGPSGGMLEIELDEEDRKACKLERITLRFSFPQVLPIMVGDEIIAQIKKPVIEYLVMYPEERPYVIIKGDTLFEIC